MKAYNFQTHCFMEEDALNFSEYFLVLIFWKWKKNIKEEKHIAPSGVSYIFLVWDSFAIDLFSGFSGYSSFNLILLYLFDDDEFWHFNGVSWSLLDTCYLSTLHNENRLPGLPYQLKLTLCQLTLFWGRTFLNKRLFSKRCLIGLRIWQQNVLLPLGATVFNYPLHLYFPCFFLP